MLARAAAAARRPPIAFLSRRALGIGRSPTAATVRRLASATAPPSAAVQKMKRSFAMAGAGMGMLLAAPLFYMIGTIAGEERPPHAERVIGDWVSVDGESRIRFNKYNMCRFDNVGGGDGRGPVQWGSSSIVVGFSFLETRSIPVEAWPSAEDDRFVCDGRTFQRQK